MNLKTLVACCVGISAVAVIATLLATSDVLAKPSPQEGGSESKGGSRSKRVNQPVELGTVNWKRDLDEAVSASKQKEKPIAILFQEVPG